MPIKLTRKIDEADILINSYSNFYGNLKLLKIAQIHKLKIYTLKNYTFIEIAKILRYILAVKVSIFDIEWQKLTREPENKLEALEEVRLAIEKIVLPKQVRYLRVSYYVLYCQLYLNAQLIIRVKYYKLKKIMPFQIITCIKKINL